MAQVITYQHPSGDAINVCEACDKPERYYSTALDSAEFCTVSHSRHEGTCTICAGTLSTHGYRIIHPPAKVKHVVTRYTLNSVYSSIEFDDEEEAKDDVEVAESLGIFSKVTLTKVEVTA